MACLGASVVSDQVTIALIGMIGAIIAGFFKMIDSQNKNQRELSKAVETLSKSSDKQTAALKEVAKETRQGNLEAKERNGHLGEQNIQITELITKHTAVMTDQFSKVQSSLDKQVVKEQKVEHQTVVKE